MKVSGSIRDEEAIQRIVRSSAPLGHKIQDILDMYGMENKLARQAAHAIAATVSQRLIQLGAIFAEGGYIECQNALMLEANTLFAD
jgi:hypothetical protein